MKDGTTLLIGPSSVGKSTWILGQKKLGTISDGRFHFAFQFDGDNPPVLDGRRLVHINMLHPFGNNVDQADAPIGTSRVLQAILTQVRPAEAIVMVAPRRVLLRRILLRQGIEPDLLGSSADYPMLQTFEFVCRVDLGEVYRRWFAALQARDIPVRFITSDGPEYRELDSIEDAVSHYHSDASVTYSQDERDRILPNFAFNYQEIHRVGAAGYPRQPTYDAIKPFVVGTSAVDIGCAQGFFCRQLEIDGFSDVLGTELKKDRFLAACALAELDGSRVRYHFGDLLDGDTAYEADTVLLLNVLHHLPNPMRGLARAWSFARRRLILEFPTLEDPLFRSTLPPGAAIDPSLPLIGVSSLSLVDQTFVFAEAAIARCFNLQKQPPRHVETLPSPLSSSRRIVVASR